MSIPKIITGTSANMYAKKYTPDDFFTKINNIQDKVRYMDIITPLEKL